MYCLRLGIRAKIYFATKVKTTGARCSRSLHQSLRMSSTLGDWFGALVAAKRARMRFCSLFELGEVQIDFAVVTVKLDQAPSFTKVIPCI